MSERRDEFLSDEDLDLKNLTAPELETYWRLWLTQAQGTNDADRAPIHTACSSAIRPHEESMRTTISLDGDPGKAARRRPIAKTALPSTRGSPPGSPRWRAG